MIFRFSLTILLLPSQVGVADIWQAKTLRHWGLQQREGLFEKLPSQKQGEQVSDRPPRRQGARGIYRIKNEEAGRSEAWGAWGSRVKATGKRCGNKSRFCAGVTKLQASGCWRKGNAWHDLRVEFLALWRQKVAHAQLESRWSSALTISAQNGQGWLQVPRKQLWQTCYCLGFGLLGEHACPFEMTWTDDNPRFCCDPTYPKLTKPNSSLLHPHLQSYPRHNIFPELLAFQYLETKHMKFWGCAWNTVAAG